MNQLTAQLALTFGWAFVGVMLILAGTWLFDRLTPIDYAPRSAKEMLQQVLSLRRSCSLDHSGGRQCGADLDASASI